MTFKSMIIFFFKAILSMTGLKKHKYDRELINMNINDNKIRFKNNGTCRQHYSVVLDFSKATVFPYWVKRFCVSENGNSSPLLKECVV